MLKLQRRFSKKSPAKSSSTSNLQTVFESAQNYDRMAASITKTKSDHYKVPWPVPELVREESNPLATSWVYDLSPFLVILAQWTLAFSLAYFNFSFSWIVLGATMYYLQTWRSKQSVSETFLAKKSAETSEPGTTREGGKGLTRLTFNLPLLAESLMIVAKSLPTWVNFPDFDRVVLIATRTKF